MSLSLTLYADAGVQLQFLMLAGQAPPHPLLSFSFYVVHPALRFTFSSGHVGRWELLG